MRLVKVLLVVLLVAAAPVGVYLLPTKDQGPTYPDTWDADVQSLVDFVEHQRGLTFARPVHVRFLDDDEFDEKVTVPEAEKEEAREEGQRLLAALRALGLVSGDADLLESIDELSRTAVVGLYDAQEKELFVQGDELTPLVRATVVHELTHALQDQHFDLAELEEQAPHGAESAVQALVEGDAERVEEAYVAQMSEPDRAAYRRANQVEDQPEVPDVLEHVLAFPYVFGPVLLDSLLARGNPGVDAAFAAPPVAEAQVLDPVRYPLSFTPSRLPDPPLPDDAQAVDEPGAFGQFTLFELLGSRLGHTRAWDAVQGWTGDRYRLFELEDRTCVAFTTRMAQAAAAVRLERALQDWSLSTDAAVQRTGREVAVRACDPGAAAAAPTRQPTAFDVLALRAALVHLGVQQGFALRQATCVVDHVVRSLGERGVSVLLENEPDRAANERVRRVFAAGQQRCR